jgi:hypothetical protein
MPQAPCSDEESSYGTKRATTINSAVPIGLGESNLLGVLADRVGLRFGSRDTRASSKSIDGGMA